MTKKTIKDIYDLYSSRAEPCINIERSKWLYNPTTGKTRSERVVYMDLNNREVLTLSSQWTKQATIDAVYELCDKFDFSYYLEFSSLDDLYQFIK